MKVLIVFVFLGLVASGLAQTVCRTPNGEQARCIPFQQCTVFKNALQNNKNPSEEVVRFLRESQCGFSNGPWVCCGSVARFQSINNPPQPPRRTPAPARATPAPYRDPPSNSNANPRSHRNINLLPTNTCGSQGSVNRIVGGEETDLDEFPWMTLLEYRMNGQNTGHHCGGMLISDRYVVTAAHCVTGPIVPALGNVFRVRLGEHNLATTRDCQLKREGNEEYEDCSDPHQDIEVEEAIPHPSYNLDGQQHNDVAVIRLSRPVNRNFYVQPICLPINGERSAPGINLFVAGWGRTETRSTSDVKLKIQVPVVSPQTCITKYSTQNRRLTDQQFCAGGLRGIDSCRGDSGGPIMTTFPGVTPLRWYVEGIVSYGPDPCGIPGWPGVYSRVASYVNWILDNMRS